ncbi:hypothetical protein N2152v2_003219 [Parachlorella kessleri]
MADLNSDSGTEVAELGSSWTDLRLLMEPSCISLIDYEMSLSRLGINREEASFTLDGQHALLLPVAASCSLLVVFYLFASIQHVMLLLVGFSSVAAVVFALHPLVAAVARASSHAQDWLQRDVSLCGGRVEATVDQVLLGSLGVAAVLVWLVTGSWLLNNFLGIAFCISFISFIRLPNLKVCSLLLSGLFVYDIFWVFFSEGLFGSNVMVAAATKQADNPVRMAAEAMHLPVPAVVARQLDLPMKLLFPRSLRHPSPQDSLMLGLGDMALPGLLLALLLCSDYRRAAKRELPGTSGAAEGGLGLLLSPRFWRGGYAGLCWLGYCAGLVLALGTGVVFQAAQPALLYLVPCTLAPVLSRAAARGELGELWGGQRMQVPPGKQEEPEERA